MNERSQAKLNELIKLVRGTEFESAAKDEKKLEELLLREMRRFDFEETFEALAAKQVEAEQKAEQAGQRADDDEPFSRGVLKRRGGRPQR